MGRFTTYLKNKGSTVKKAVDDEFLILQGFKVLWRLPFKQPTENVMGHFILWVLSNGC